MASQMSLKELSKALTAFIPEPTLPLPDDLIETIAAYLRRHPKYEEAAADRLQEELVSIYEKHVKGNATASTAWIAILRHLLPMIQTPERVITWLDLLKGVLNQHTTHGKATVDETIAGLMDLVRLADEYQDVSEEEVTLNPIMHRLFIAWMDRYYPAFVEGIPGMEYNERMFREALVQFGKRRPLQFFASLDSFFVQSKYRKAALRFLCDFIQNRPPHLHQILEGPLFRHLLTCLQEDTSTAVVSAALTALVMLLPHMPSSLVPHLPVLFNIYARILFWNGKRSGAAELPSRDPEKSRNWEACSSIPGVDDGAVVHLANYYTILYGLYPLNFMDYIRKPQRYLRHANVPNAEEFEVQPTELRDQSERFRKSHLLHPNFYTLTVESEKTDAGRWIKSEAAEVVAECMALCPPGDLFGGPSLDETPMPGVQALPVTVEPEKESPDAALLSSSVPLGSISARINSTSSLHTMTRVESHSSATSNRDLTEVRSRDSGADSQSLVQSPSHTQLRDLIQSNKAIKSGLHQPSANESDGSPAPSHRNSTNEQPAEANATQMGFFSSPMSLTDVNSQVAHLQRQNLMLQNDLSFERYQKQQHIAHIGELRRKQVAQAATEAETQNLIIMNRNLKSRYEEAKKVEMQVRKESEKSRALAKKWEADLSAKLKNLRGRSKETSSELGRVRGELEDATSESDKLRKLVCVGEVKELNWKQNMQSVELHGVEIDRLKAEVERLSVSERDNQAKEQERLAAIEAAAAAESRAEALKAELAAHETELQRARKLFESQVRELHARLAEAMSRDDRPRTAGLKPELESIMSGSRAKQAEMQKQYDLLMRKYTALQSSLLDMQSGATPEQIKMEVSGLPMASGEYFPKNGPAQAKAKSRFRGLSNPENPDATSYNVTPPLKGKAGSSTQGQQRPATPTGAEPGPQSTSPEQRYFGRGGLQNRIRKDGKGKGKDEEGGSSSGKKDKKSTGLRGIRSGVGEFVRGKTE